jgi:hypothetical protein
MSRRFVSVPSERLFGELEQIGALIVTSGGSMKRWRSGSEVVFDFAPSHGRAMVRVYTSIAEGATSARACGEDAVRVVVGVDLPRGFRPLAASRKVLRTAPASGDRVTLFLERLRGVLRLAYAEALAVPACPLCGRPMARRARANATPGAGDFFGCVAFPECRGTRSISSCSRPAA